MDIVHKTRLIENAPDMHDFLLIMKSYFKLNPNGYDSLRELCNEILERINGDDE